MTRSRGARRSRRGRRPNKISLSGSDKVEIVTGKTILTTASFVSAIPLTVDTFGSRLSTLGSVFQEHRFTAIRLVLHPAFASGGVTRTGYVVGYYKVIPQTPPTTSVNLYQGAVSRLNDIADTVPVVLNLNRSVLNSNVRTWYTNNSATGTSALDSTQGVLYIIGNGLLVNGLTATIEVSYVVEFRGATLPAVD
jgi:hypothetical protein